MNNLPKNVLAYLKKYSIPGWKIECSGLTGIDNIVVIPAIKEYDNIQDLLISLCRNDPEYFKTTLILFVINNSPDASPDILEDNKLSISFIRSLIEGKNDPIISAGLRIGMVDASSPGRELPAKDAGVGFARKIGMDLALTVFDYYSSQKKIIICTDADCTFSSRYLTEIISSFNKYNFNAAVVNFEHSISGSDENIKAIICYEIFLRYYVQGLKYASSPYSFHTVGSSMACDAESYIRIEGMNKKKAAEDFYFLEKLAKTVKINKITSASVYPSSRSSWRVPFGTGQRVNRFISDIQNEYLLYDPLSFELLKQWLTLFNEINKDSVYYLEHARSIHHELHNFLVNQNFKNDWDRIVKNSPSSVQLNRQKQLWFDGFRTLKLIHHLRDSGFPLINMFKALDALFSKFNIGTNFEYKEEIPPLPVQIEYLSILRRLDIS